MIAMDTNLLVRLLTNDDKQQAHYATRLIQNHSVFIPKTVLLETEWVLRYSYKIKSLVILEAFKKLMGLSHVTVEDPANVSQALLWYEKNLDFADALHLASSQKTEQFATLDKDLFKKAKKLGIKIITQ